MTIQKQIMREHCHFTNVAIRINKPSPPRIIVPTPQIVQPRLLIKHIPAIPERLYLAQRLRQFTSAPQRRTPRIVAVADDGIAILIQNRNNVTLQALDVGIRRAIVHHHRRTILRIVEEMQLIRAGSHMHNILAVQRVLRHHAIDRFLHAQAVRVVDELRRHARFLHLLQLPAVLPSVRPRPVAQRIANRIVANRISVDCRELVAPVRVTVGIGNSFQRSRRIGIRKAFLFQDVAAEVVGVLPRRAIFAGTGIAVVVDLNQLPQRVVGVARPLAVQRRTRNVPIVVVAVAAIATGLGNRRDEIRHAARAVAARRKMVFARERLAAQLDRRERRPIQLVNGRRALPDFLAARTVRQRRRTIFVIIAEFRPKFLSIFTHFLREFTQVAVHVVVSDLSRVHMLTSFCGLYAHRTIRQVVLALRRPIQQIVADSCYLPLCVVVVFVSRRGFLAVDHPRHADCSDSGLYTYIRDT